MQIIRVFPRRTSMTPTDDYAFIGDPPMAAMRPPCHMEEIGENKLATDGAYEVHVSCTFTWDITEAWRLKGAWSQYYPHVIIGGPAFSSSRYFEEPERRVPSGCQQDYAPLYVKSGVIFTSRGCNNQCPWCLVPIREGKLIEMTSPIGACHYKDTIYVQDNNLLQCSNEHIRKVFAFCRYHGTTEFTGGLDATLVKDWMADEFRSIRIKQVFLACDTKQAIGPLKNAIKLLGMPMQKVRCYVLLKFNPDETISEATERMVQIWEAGAMPFAQLYQPPEKWIDYSWEWKRFARTWSRVPAMKAKMRAIAEIEEEL